MTTTRPGHARRLLLATLIAGAGSLGPGVAPAVAWSKTIKWDPAKYHSCSQYWADQYTAGKVTEKEWDQAAQLCCASSGGDLVKYPDGSWRCAEPVEFTPRPAHPVTRIPTDVFVPTTEMTPIGF